VVDLSSFKCGHDAPTYSIIDKILGASRTPHLTLHDIDANKPGGSIKIRVKTFAYTLEQYKRTLENRQLLSETDALASKTIEKEKALT
jgi:predicted nucleotide-binding protein (sugar kinase/HSP70/actin superfamily)